MIVNMDELYILEQPIETEIGLLYPILVRDYRKFAQFNGLISLDKNAIVNNFKELANQDNKFKPLLDLSKELHLFEFVKAFSGEEFSDSFLYDLYYQYKELFKFCFKNDVFDLIKNNEEFDKYISLIRDVNGIEYDPTSPNPEVERRKELKRKLESMKKDNISFESIFTSVCVGLKKLPSEVNTMSIYSFDKIFQRIGQFKNYDTSTLFATVSQDVKIDEWYKSTDIKKELAYITEDQLNMARQNKKLQSDL